MKFTKYGVCSKTADQVVNPVFASFPISATKVQDCQITLLDNQNTIYQFRLTKQPPYHSENHVVQPEPFTCTVSNPVQNDWCKGLFAYTIQPNGDPKPSHYAVTPAPTQ